jgi:hypothetical protein
LPANIDRFRKAIASLWPRRKPNPGGYWAASPVARSPEVFAKTPLVKTTKI